MYLLPLFYHSASLNHDFFFFEREFSHYHKLAAVYYLQYINIYTLNSHFFSLSSSFAMICFVLFLGVKPCKSYASTSEPLHWLLKYKLSGKPDGTLAF